MKRSSITLRIIVVSVLMMLFSQLGVIAMPSSNVVKSFPAPDGAPRGLAFDGTYLWNVSTSDNGQELFYKIDISNGTVLNSYPTPGNGVPLGLTFDGTYLWHSDMGTDMIYKIDPTTMNVVSSFNSPRTNPADLAWDGQYLWVSVLQNGPIIKIDPNTGLETDSVSAPGTRPFGLTYVNGMLYNGDDGTDTIYVINPNSGDVVDSFASPGTYPAGLTFDGEYLWISDFDTDTIYQWNINDDPLDHFIYLPIITNNFNPAMENSSVHIDAESGGSVNLGQITLSIPAGALSQDTTVTVARPIDSPDVGDRGIGYLQLEPSGLTFNMPASLSIGYEEPLTFEEEWLAVYTYNETMSRWEELNITSHDTVNNNIVVDVNHFSWVTSIFDRPVDLVLEIPGKFLKKGDLVYTQSLTEGSNKFTWFPGHVGLYMGSSDPHADPNDPNDNDGQTIIESTPGEFNHRSGCLAGGVRKSNLSSGYYSFMKAPYHLYMGARRLPGLSGEDRTIMASYASSKLNRGYSLIASGNLGDNCYSCVGLTEAAYDDAGKSIIPGILELPFIIPLEQYIRTQPIDEITVRAGDAIDFDAKRIYRSISQDQYVSDSSVAISGCPSGATCSRGSIDWAPTNADVGDHVLHFATSVIIDSKTYSAAQTLTIHVIGTGTGTISGRVVDATTGSGIIGATVSIDGTDHSTITSSNGSYALNDIPTGSYTITAQKSGNIQISSDVTVFANETTTKNIALPNAAYPSDIVVTLTWGESPRDLDSHLWLPASTPYHIYYSNEGSLTSHPFTKLDVDDISSYGPENITIRQQYNGIYTYAVYNYSGSPNITASSATVIVVKDGILVQTFTIPTTGSGRWWHVFDYDAVTKNIIPRNYITDSSPGPYGTVHSAEIEEKSK